jgi:hypothetical protein
MEVSALESRAWRIAHSGLDLDQAFTAFDELLRPPVRYAIASWSTHDPATGLFTSCTMSGAPKDPVGEARYSSNAACGSRTRSASPSTRAGSPESHLPPDGGLEPVRTRCAVAVRAIRPESVGRHIAKSIRGISGGAVPRRYEASTGSQCQCRRSLAVRDFQALRDPGPAGRG